MIETVKRKRIEILMDTPLAPRLIRYVKEAGISGWSLIHVDSGGGRHGEWRHDDVTGAAAKTIMLVVANEEKAGALIDRVAPILDSHRLLLLMSDVEVVRGGRF
jgi:PII-like signaling protein